MTVTRSGAPFGSGRRRGTSSRRHPRWAGWDAPWLWAACRLCGVVVVVRACVKAAPKMRWVGFRGSVQLGGSC